MKFIDMKPAESVVALCVGNAGSGKSSAIASFATKDKPMYVFDCDHRLDGINGSRAWLTENLPHIEVDTYNTEGGFFNTIERRCEEFIRQYKSNRATFPFGNLVFDSIGSISEMLLQDSMYRDPTSNRAGFNETIYQRDKGKRPLPADYLYASRCWREIFYRVFKSFKGVNVFLSSWTTDRYGKAPEAPYGPDVLLPGKQVLATQKVANEVPGYFNEVWEFSKEEQSAASLPCDFSVRFESYLAKTSIPELALKKRLIITRKNFKSELDRVIKGDMK